MRAFKCESIGPTYKIFVRMGDHSKPSHDHAVAASDGTLPIKASVPIVMTRALDAHTLTRF